MLEMMIIAVMALSWVFLWPVYIPYIAFQWISGAPLFPGRPEFGP